MFDDPALVGCSWTELADRLDAANTVTGWSMLEVGLDGLAAVDELLTRWRDPHTTNAVLLALVRLAASDGGRDDDALLVLLHLLSGVVWRLVGRLGDLSTDVTAVVLAELTCQIRTYRWRTWRGSVCTSLELQTRRAVLDDLLLRDSRHVDRREVQPLHGTVWGGQDHAAVDDAEDLDIVDMLLWAAGRGVPIEDLELLLASERARGSFGSRADERIARQRGIARRTLLRRRARTLDALRELAPTYLAEVA